ncbi:DUF4145 domain-containing protein [Plantibacter sp. VKM Ac-2885]|uniref:DUF4145 domain-containing protein n=1 Tax=Plantibacter sp. VKM Ac-2885 TaxID=2783828 RepID=UPI00188CD27D|nr:DUF4145 domain-containing protein [Plantibacter sp. VKM Ac-2885]MBF4511332.1 DUF4145 domain-containing protein [Plantibacter sp. VKM Ac-2885]
MPTTISPRVDLDRFNCLRCASYSHHVWEELRVRLAMPQGGTRSEEFSDDAGSFVFDGGRFSIGFEGRQSEWKASLCLSCNASTVWRNDQVIYPMTSTLQAPHPDMPASAAELYEEARAVFPLSRRASAALARAALERLLREEADASPKDRLDDLIAALKNRIGESLWQLLTTIRYVGNTTLHGDDGQELVALFLEGSDADVAEPMLGAMNALVEELVTQPAKAAALYAMIPAGVRKSAEEKAYKA